VPVFMPMRVTDELCDMLREFHPLWLNIHVNHPNEITKELAEACAKLADAGIPLGNQSVLLAGINDCVHIQRKLVRDLIRMRVRPYYLYICDLVEGAGHFRTPVSKGVEIIEGLRGHTSGFAVPTFVVDARVEEGRFRWRRITLSAVRIIKWCCAITKVSSALMRNRRTTRRMIPRPVNIARKNARKRDSLEYLDCWMARVWGSNPKDLTDYICAKGLRTACVRTKASGKH